MTLLFRFTGIEKGGKEMKKGREKEEVRSTTALYQEIGRAHV